jgi:hypothetical protein
MTAAQRLAAARKKHEEFLARHEAHQKLRQKEAEGWLEGQKQAIDSNNKRLRRELLGEE